MFGIIVENKLYYYVFLITWLRKKVRRCLLYITIYKKVRKISHNILSDFLYGIIITKVNINLFLINISVVNHC